MILLLSFITKKMNAIKRLKQKIKNLNRILLITGSNNLIIPYFKINIHLYFLLFSGGSRLYALEMHP